MMFECPECGGVIETTAHCYFCVVCDFFAERHFVNLDGGRGYVRWTPVTTQAADYEWSAENVAA
jgi:hypothetical protein